jgi:cytochrome P450
MTAGTEAALHTTASSQLDLWVGPPLMLSDRMWDSLCGSIVDHVKDPVSFSIMLTMDEPDHRRLRSLVEVAFAWQSVDRRCNTSITKY